MKKIFGILLISVLLFSLSACGSSSNNVNIKSEASVHSISNDVEPASIDGKSITIMEKAELNVEPAPEIKDIDEDASTINNKEAKDIDENTSEKTADSPIKENSTKQTKTPKMIGPWEKNYDLMMTAEGREIFETAIKGFVGVNFKPISMVGKQIVAGVNYAFLCEAKSIFLNSKTEYALVFVYELPDGNIELINIQKLYIEDAEDFDLDSIDLGVLYDYEKAAALIAPQIEYREAD